MLVLHSLGLLGSTVGGEGIHAFTPAKMTCKSNLSLPRPKPHQRLSKPPKPRKKKLLYPFSRDATNALFSKHQFNLHLYIHPPLPFVYSCELPDSLAPSNKFSTLESGDADCERFWNLSLNT